jgi:hypothetical protein
MFELILERLNVIRRTGAEWKSKNALPGLFIRMENLIVLAITLAIYFGHFETTWQRVALFVGLLIVPDVSMLGYVFGGKIGGFCYDLFHFYPVAAACVLGGMRFGVPVATDIGLIWCIHIAQDRVRGFGFKYAGRYDDGYMYRI